MCECVEFDVPIGGRPYRTLDICKVGVDQVSLRHCRALMFGELDRAGAGAGTVVVAVVAAATHRCQSSWEAS